MRVYVIVGFIILSFGIWQIVISPEGGVFATVELCGISAAVACWAISKYLERREANKQKR
jgi:hypothetical protein